MQSKYQLYTDEVVALALQHVVENVIVCQFFSLKDNFKLTTLTFHFIHILIRVHV